MDLWLGFLDAWVVPYLGFVKTLYHQVTKIQRIQKKQGLMFFLKLTFVSFRFPLVSFVDKKEKTYLM